MRKKRVSSAELTWMIFERTREESGMYETPVSVAVIPDAELGWRIIQKDRRRTVTPAAARRLRSIENELRSEYDLLGD